MITLTDEERAVVIDALAAYINAAYILRQGKMTLGDAMVWQQRIRTAEGLLREVQEMSPA